MKGVFITFEGNEGSGKSTQIALLAEQLGKLGYAPRVLREPGSTPVGEEIRHTLKHSPQNQAMAAETELLLMNASRAQLVREVIRPALAAGELVLCDRFYDSTIAYQGYGRGLDLAMVRTIIDIAVGDTHPDLTLLLTVPVRVTEARRKHRESTTAPVRDRIEDADPSFFENVERGYKAIAASEPERIRVIDATAQVDAVQREIWQLVQPLLKRAPKKGGTRR